MSRINGFYFTDGWKNNAKFYNLFISITNVFQLIIIIITIIVFLLIKRVKTSIYNIHLLKRCLMKSVPIYFKWTVLLNNTWLMRTFSLLFNIYRFHLKTIKTFMFTKTFNKKYVLLTINSPYYLEACTLQCDAEIF